MVDEESVLHARIEALVIALPAAARSAIEYASLFPPDLIATHWLMRLVAHERPGLDLDAPGRASGSTVWDGLLEDLERDALLQLGRNGAAEPTARMHPAVGRQVRRLMADDREADIGEALNEIVAGLCAQAVPGGIVEASQIRPLTPILSEVALHLAGGRHASVLTAESLGQCARIEQVEGRPARCLILLRARFAVAARLAADWPGDPDCARQLARARHMLALFLENRASPGDVDEALALQLEPFAHLAEHHDDVATGDALALAWIDEARLLRGGGADLDDRAYDYLRAALTYFSERGGADLHRADLYRELGDLLDASGNRDEALKCFERALALSTALVEARPDDDAMGRCHAEAMSALGACLPAGDGSEVLRRKAALLHGVIAAQHARVDRAPGNAWILRDYALALERWGDFVLAHLGREQTPNALDACLRAIEIRWTLHRRDPGVAVPMAELIICNHRLPAVHQRLGAIAAARMANAESLRLLDLYVARGFMLVHTLIAVREAALATKAALDRRFR